MSLDRFELLELRHDDGIQTYHAREMSTARPVQVHLFAAGETRDALELMRKLIYLPETERRRVIDRGTYQGVPYLVTDRLAGFASVREWIDAKSAPTLDEQFAHLFEPEPEPDLFAPPNPGPEPDMPDPDPEPHPEPVHPRPKLISILGLILGFAAALIVLVVLIAIIAFRPHQL